MFIVSKPLLISGAIGIVCAGGSIWLNPFVTVLFTVCSAVTIECCVLYAGCVGVFGMFAVITEEGSSPVSLQLLRGGIWGCIRCTCLFLCWVLGWDYVSQLPHMCGIMLVFKSSFQHAREECVSMNCNIMLVVCMLVGMVV